MNRISSCLCILTFMIVVFSASAVAQKSPTGKSSKIVSGGFLFSSAGGDLYAWPSGERFVLIQFDPSIDYFVAPGIAVGGQLLLGRTSQGSYRISTWGLGPQIRYFVGGNRGSVHSRTATYPYISLALLYTETSFKRPNYYRHESYAAVRLGGGMVRMLSGAVGLYGGASYQLDTMCPGRGWINGNQFNITAGFILFLY